jgi:two-component system, cell cycle sensor histidine kinase DivJ
MRSRAASLVRLVAGFMRERSEDEPTRGVPQPDGPVLEPERQLAEAPPGEAKTAASEDRMAELAGNLRSARAAASGSSLAIAKASHELRAPLNGIIGLAEVLRHKADAGTISPAEAGRLAGAIHESGVHLLHLVEALLDLARLEVTQQAAARTIAIRSEVDVALSALGPMAERKRIAVENACDPRAEWTGDQRAFRQIAINLVSNALKFSPAGSTVRIAATQSAEALALHVGDQGPGVSEGDRERILLPFDRGRDAGCEDIDGVGLGLTVVAELLKRQGGRLVIEAAAGGGSISTAVFPAARRPEPQDGALPDGTSRAPASRS